MVDPHGIPDAIDREGTRWRLSYETNSEGRVNAVKIAGYRTGGGAHQVTLNGIGSSSVCNHSVFFVFSPDSHSSQLGGIDSIQAMRIAQAYFDAMLGPFEEAVGLANGRPKPGDGREKLIRDGFSPNVDRATRMLSGNPTGIAPDSTHLVR